VATRSGTVAADIYCYPEGPDLRLIARRDEVERLFEGVGGEVRWDAVDSSKKNRTLTIRKAADFEQDDWQGIYEWTVACLWRLRSAVELVG
jgi:hypothetical protein